MNILITGASAPLSRHLASALGGRHTITLTDIADVPGVVRCDLDHDDATSELVRGMDVIVHSGQTDINADVSERLDTAMRRLYNLVWAAYEERATRAKPFGSHWPRRRSRCRPGARRSSYLPIFHIRSSQ